MPKFKVYVLQDEVTIRKYVFEVEAEDQEDAIDVAMNADVEPIETGTFKEAEYAAWGWSGRPVGADEDEAAWKEAFADLERKRWE